MTFCNPVFEELSENYLFMEVKKRVDLYREKNPEAVLLPLGIGDTTFPLISTVAEELGEKARFYQTKEGYRGYGAEAGVPHLRKKIQEVFYPDLISSDEVFVSDGAKCDLGRLQLLFSEKTRFGVMAPSYPVYKESILLSGRGRSEIAYFSDPSSPEWNKILDIEADVLFLCSPNNPTGVPYTYDQLRAIVNQAKKKKQLLIFDAAYASFIRSPLYPKTLYAVEGALEVGIEVGSFSKMAGFSGLRCGWSVVPQALEKTFGKPIHKYFKRIVTTVFNGASSLVQEGAYSALSEKNRKEMDLRIDLYLSHKNLLQHALLERGFLVETRSETPYLWVKGFNDSWEGFYYFLHECGLITTPGSGFGEEGEGAVRLSSFCSTEHIRLASERILQQQGFSFSKVQVF